MVIKSLALKNFRNHTYSTFEFSEGINIFVGDNAIGKTNIAEAIYYLSLARSFRGVDDIDLIQKGKERSEILAVVSEGELNRKIHVLFDKQGRRVLINGKPIQRIAELAKCVNVVIFEPKDVMLFKGSPKERRGFLDINISKRSTPYFDLKSRYDKVLRERNEVLKSKEIDPVLLEANTEMLIELSDSIVNYRALYVKDITDILNKITRALTGEKSKVDIHYKPFEEPGADFKIKAKEAFKRAEESDFKQKATTIGIHREDFSISLNGRDIALFGSQGENRMVALALKLSPYFLIEDRDKRPVVVLDDVMSELDAGHRQKLIKFLKKMKQVFITATSLEVEGASYYQIKK